MDDFISKTINNIQKNNMEAYYAQNKEEALNIVKGMVKEGSTVARGGSVSLDDIGINELLKSGKYNYINRDSVTLSAEQKIEAMHKAFFADYYFSSANAVTINGELYNVDGNCNRIAAIAYGPQNVIIIVGRNKIVPTLPDAAKRVKTIAAPLNAKRLKLKTYCALNGECVNTNVKDNFNICTGCESDQRICSTVLITAKQRIKNRIKVIIVNENLGY